VKWSQLSQVETSPHILPEPEASGKHPGQAPSRRVLAASGEGAPTSVAARLQRQAPGVRLSAQILAYS